ncbi:MAG TPA: hypothetical protein VE646_07685 [Actinomycetota bacterium]|nr:hypothetical protein [Actinomycetota bacterium]
MLRTGIDPSIERITEPIVAWRAWTLFSRGHHAELRLRPIVGGRRSWPPRRPAGASCPRRCRPVPGVDCVCGLYATHDPLALRHARDPAVVGTVALWGRVVEHDLGYRASRAYPQRLALVCHLCFWQWGLDRARPDHVARLRGGRLVPLCRPHVEMSNRYGYRTPSLMPADAVEQALLDTYAVDPLRVEPGDPSGI